LDEDHVDAHAPASHPGIDYRHVKGRDIQDAGLRESSRRTRATEPDEFNDVRVGGLQGRRERSPKEYAERADAMALLDEAFRQRLRFGASLPPQDRVAGPHDAREIDVGNV
jgi:hypothetical protein